MEQNQTNEQGNNSVQLVNTSPTDLSFGNSMQFDHAQRVAKMLSSSSLIPKEFQGNIANTMIALEMANRIGASPLMVMQNLYIVHGKPSWSGAFVIAAINACGRFSPLHFEMTGSGDTLSCRAWATERKTGERLNGTTVTMAMAKAEGWVNKPGSKWQTMPEQMIQYRSGAFFGRVYCPDILMGMPTDDEVQDFTVMVTPDQEQTIESLMLTCSYDEHRQRGIRFKIANNMTSAEAVALIAELRNNQLDPITHGAPNSGFSSGDISRHSGKLMNPIPHQHKQERVK